MKEPERLKEQKHDLGMWDESKESSRYWFEIQNSMRHATYINFETSSTGNGIWMRYNAVRWQQWYWRKWGPAPTSSDRSH